MPTCGVVRYICSGAGAHLAKTCSDGVDDASVPGFVHYGWWLVAAHHFFPFSTVVLWLYNVLFFWTRPRVRRSFRFQQQKLEQHAGPGSREYGIFQVSNHSMRLHVNLTSRKCCGRSIIQPAERTTTTTRRFYPLCPFFSFSPHHTTNPRE